jgi:hypothetical protein
LFAQRISRAELRKFSAPSDVIDINIDFARPPKVVFTSYITVYKENSKEMPYFLKI